MSKPANLSRNFIAATLFLITMFSCCQDVLAQPNIVRFTPSKPTKSGRDSFVFSKGPGKPNVVVGVDVNQNWTQREKRDAIVRALRNKGLRAKATARGGIRVDGQNLFSWRSGSGEKKDKAVARNANLAHYYFDGQPTGLDGFGNPATYMAGFHSDGFSAEIEISALDMPQQIPGEQIVDILQQQLHFQLPREIQPMLFADPMDRMIGLDAALLGPAPIEFVWGTTDLGMTATAEFESFSQLPQPFPGDVDPMFQDVQPSFGELRGGDGNLIAVPEPHFGLTGLLAGFGLIASRRKYRTSRS